MSVDQLLPVRFVAVMSDHTAMLTDAHMSCDDASQIIRRKSFPLFRPKSPPQPADTN